MSQKHSLGKTTQYVSKAVTGYAGGPSLKSNLFNHIKAAHEFYTLDVADR